MMRVEKQVYVILSVGGCVRWKENRAGVQKPPSGLSHWNLSVAVGLD